MRQVECPYCGAGLDICHDDNYGYEEDQTHQQECSECGKSFAYSTTIHFSYRVRKADCLNGSPHAFKKTNTYSREFATMRCTECDYERPLMESER